jgi:hypothetical protein
MPISIWSYPCSDLTRPESSAWTRKPRDALAGAQSFLAQSKPYMAPALYDAAAGDLKLADAKQVAAAETPGLVQAILRTEKRQDPAGTTDCGSAQTVTRYEFPISQAVRPSHSTTTWVMLSSTGLAIPCSSRVTWIQKCSLSWGER